MEFAKRLKRRRQELGLSAKVIAKHLGVAPSTYFDWEHGRQITGMRHYANLARVLDLSVSELINGKSSKKDVYTALEEVERIIKSIKLLL